MSLEKKEREPHPFIHFTDAMKKLEEMRTKHQPVISGNCSVNLDHLDIIAKIDEGKEKEKKEGKGWDVRGLAKF